MQSAAVEAQPHSKSIKGNKLEDGDQIRLPVSAA